MSILWLSCNRGAFNFCCSDWCERWIISPHFNVVNIIVIGKGWWHPGCVCPGWTNQIEEKCSLVWLEHSRQFHTALDAIHVPNDPLWVPLHNKGMVWKNQDLPSSSPTFHCHCWFEVYSVHTLGFVTEEFYNIKFRRPEVSLLWSEPEC